MSFPIDGCTQTLVFPSKTMCQRHWTEKHLNEVVSYSRRIFHCKVYCRVRYDMKVHLLRVHNTAKWLVERILSKSQRNYWSSGSLINPGMFTFYDRTSSTADKDVPLMPLVPEYVTTSSSSTDAPVEIPCPDPIELEPPAKGVLTIQEYLLSFFHLMCPRRPSPCFFSRELGRHLGEHLVIRGLWLSFWNAAEEKLRFVMSNTHVLLTERDYKLSLLLWCSSFENSL